MSFQYLNEKIKKKILNFFIFFKSYIYMKNRFCPQGQFLNFRKKICEKILYFPILFPESRSRDPAIGAKTRGKVWNIKSSCYFFFFLIQKY